MPDLTAISTALSTIGSAIDIGKTLRQVDRSLDTAEYKLRVSELLVALSEAKSAIADIKSELIETRAQIAELEEKLRFRESLVLENGLYYSRGSGGERNPDPYCSRCWDAQHKPIHVTLLSRDTRQTVYSCPECKNDVVMEGPDAGKPLYLGGF